MPWQQFLSSDWYSGIPTLTVIFLVFAVLVLRTAKSFRARVLRLAGLFAISILATFVAGVFAAFGYEPGQAFAAEFAVVVAGISLIQVLGIFLFHVLLPRVRLNPPQILSDVLIVVALIVFGLTRLSVHKMDPSSILTTSALITAVIALSLQDTLGNLLGGLALQIDQSIKVGDWVKLDNLAGKVTEIRWRQTSIETNDWETIVVPNSVLVRNRFLVLGRRAGQPVHLRRWVPFYVDNIFSPDQVIDAVQTSLRSMDIPGVAKSPAAQCFIIDLAENPARYAVSYWLTDLTAMNPGDSNIRVQTYLALKRAGVPIGTPTRSVAMSKESAEKRHRKWEQELQARVAALRTVDIFQGFTEEELHQLAERLQPAPYLAGDAIIRQGGAANRLYIVVDGTADVVVENDGQARAKVAELGPGQFFGEMGLMTGEPRSATVVAQTRMQTYRLDKNGFRDLLAARPDVAEGISELLARRAVELEAVRDNLDAETRARRTADKRHDIRQKIWSFFGLQD